jgi:hypothetical protein
MDPFTSTDTKRIAGPWLWQYHLGFLIEGHFPPKDYSATFQCYLNEDELEYKEDAWATITIGAAEYTKMKRCLLSLQHVGLDVRGGLKRLYQIYQRCTDYDWSGSSSRNAFPTAPIIVIDPQEAAKYFRFGVHLNKVSASLSNYHTKNPLDQATKIYSMIEEWVQSHSQQRTLCEEDLDARISATTDKNLIWEYKREKFGLATVKKYRAIMIQKAVEENVRLPLWCIRLSW